MIVEQTRFTRHGFTCLLQRDLPHGPHCTADQNYRVTVDGLHVATAGRESDALRYAQFSADRLAVAAGRCSRLALPGAAA
jgi:hypothetical protein